MRKQLFSNNPFHHILIPFLTTFRIGLSIKKQIHSRGVTKMTIFEFSILDTFICRMGPIDAI